MNIPSAYQAGCDKARALNPQLATKYVEHTVIDDPMADAAIDALAAFSQKDVHRFIHAGMEQDAGTLAMAPQPLQDFFESIDSPPPCSIRNRSAPVVEPSTNTRTCLSLSSLSSPYKTSPA